MESITIEHAINVFVHGFAFTRSRTFPYLVKRISDNVWRLHDAARRSGDYRTEEFVAYGLSAAELDAIVERESAGRNRLCVIRRPDESEEELRADFKNQGYRLNTTEPFMAHDLRKIEPVNEPLPVVSVTTLEQASALAKAVGCRQMRPEYLTADPPPMRQYAVMDGDTPVGWVASIPVCGSAWCSNMLVQPAYRRRGIARALLTRMLKDDREAGAQWNVLLASHTGARLYPTVGYDTIGELFMYSRVRSLGTISFSIARGVFMPVESAGDN